MSKQMVRIDDMQAIISAESGTSKGTRISAVPEVLEAASPMGAARQRRMYAASIIATVVLIISVNGLWYTFG